MPRVAIVTDSTCDLPTEIRARRSIAMVPLTITIGELSLLDQVEITAEEFYQRVAASSHFPTTSQPAPGLFAETFERLLLDHDHVLSIHISSKLSGTVESARQAAGMVDRSRITVFDSLSASMALGQMVLVAADMAARGSEPERILATLEPIRERTQAYFTVANLESLRRGGRIGRASALLGGVLQVKPVLHLVDGMVAPLERVRTMERAIHRVIELALAVDTGQGICAIVGHAAEPAVAERLAAAIKPHTVSLLIQPLGPVIGAHAGAGTVGIGAYPAELYPLELD